ncbi:ABC transporter ATP-binding protein [candidate division CPR3 bacterium GWF2_35_18]|uniref:Phosphonate-transporting ATPase n=1 Tax=candidate division CPR3 bacterium GW2011_GWF2_35_18 TaxID=1618350 RepID=A0A0G0BIS7_UNCC3|nr:MAG: Phosphonate-transporting ATPase [candidate division CPR3 bacterium GW2011_GWF2_35_18]KKP86962.1 MAG: Phosphonate-transporting ATPase [candidate division CPR3 bacterium GW2011_GWE2_35_7]OGB62565.1 MAG: ABC transporter ATP-binding protein [candidate division CPR3 bacterium GWF2_35_18]OGB65816.1 MAG: ABC transporter ATP-binding protein [candidate division CPR3 bacterium RIFOXYA2_FULL_35_13]OGB76637.1 MAG: ABC transporter ATP-binding protein [candidate division CPR3 bacterium RIFOXYC2_FULL_
MKKEVVIKVKDLHKKYNGELEAVKGISFEVYKNEVFGLLGPNGAGKTTTVEMMESLRSISNGEISILGFDVRTNIKELKERIGVQLQSSAFFEELTVCETLDLFASFYKYQKDLAEIIDDFDLQEKKNTLVKKLSGGQRQRLSIGVAMVNDPEVIFLDEPTTGLDPQARRHTWEIIKKLKQRGKTVILTTHYMEEAEVLCDRVAIMDEGKIITLDTPQKLIENLLKSGFKKERVRQLADLEDVFLNLTGKSLRE